MASEAFKRAFWDILTEVAEPTPTTYPAPGGGRVDRTRVAVVIEDEEDIRFLLADVLEQAGFVVHTAGNGLDGVRLVNEVDPLVTTLDVNMPGMDGFETARRIRAASATYIVMLTARTEEIDALQGLDAGADDYVTKPFRPRELRARIEAMLRRPRMHTSAPTPPPGEAQPGSAAPIAQEATAEAEAGWLEHNGLRLSTDMRIATVGDDELELTRSEFDILAELLTAGRRVVSKGELALMLRGERFTGSEFLTESDSRAIEVHMANLRRKLGESPSDPRWIETVRGVGYRITAR